MGVFGLLVLLISLELVQAQSFELTCETGQQKIIGPWRYSSKTCTEVNAARLQEYDSVYLAECRRWIGKEVTRIGDANMIQCLKNYDGRVRYRHEVCCDASTVEHRCFTCNNILIPYDYLQGAYVPEVCDYNHTVETCLSGQVCLTTHNYNTSGTYVTKGCQDADDCEDLQDDNSATCRYRHNGTCSYCCNDRFCNHLERPRYLGYVYTPTCCFNGGTCRADQNLTCLCPAGYSGDRCQYSGCSSRPCKNQAYCERITTSPYYKCHCRPQYTGTTCETDADRCSVKKCQNGGSCYSHSYGTRCVCPLGYVGDTCEIPSLKCDTKDLHYNRTYYSGYLNSRTCSEWDKYFKTYLSYLLWNCLNHVGQSYVDKTSYRGVTEVPDAGVYYCEHGSNLTWIGQEACCPACFSDPCQNGGWCQSDGQGYVCKCRFSYEGKNCEYRTSMCLVSGDPHYTTFDNQILHFQGTCKYNLVTPTASSLPQFQILGKNELRNGIAHGSFLQYAEIVVGENVARLDRYKKVYVNDVQYYPYSVVGPFTIENNGVYVRVVATLEDSNSEELEVAVESDGEWITIIKLPPEYKTNVTGLCGNFNGVKDDDLTTCDGTDVTDEENKYTLIGSSCQVDDPSDPECKNPVNDSATCTEDEVHEITSKCDYILGPVFEGCSSLNLENHHESCTFDVCVTKNETAACSSLEALAVQCASSGSSFNWREATDCPLPCESPLVYLASSSACPATCKQPNAAKVCHLPDKETCACPAETPILYKGKCISGDKCPCFTPEGSEVKVGSIWYNSDCTRKYTCEMCETCTTPELTSESQSCSTSQVCVETDGQYGCFDLPDCDQCKLVQNELGYLPDLENSRAYYQCVLQPDSSWDVMRRWCPDCTVWNQDLPACDWIPELLPTGCSSEEIIYTETTEIYPDGSCKRGSFHAQKHPDSACQYEHKVRETWVVGSCAPGTAFNLVSCGCIHSPDCNGAPSVGKCLTFDDGWNNLGFSGIWIGWSYDGRSAWQSFKTAPGYKRNAGVFEKHILEIPAFSYNAWKDFDISFRFKQNARTSGRQGVISNGDCVSAPSLLIALTDYGEVTVELRPSGQNAPQPGPLTSLTSSDKYETGAWHYVFVRYYQQTLSLTVNNVLQGYVYLDDMPGEDWIRHRCPVRIGVSMDRTTDKQEYFNGLLDEICFNWEL